MKNNFKSLGILLTLLLLITGCKSENIIKKDSEEKIKKLQLERIINENGIAKLKCEALNNYEIKGILQDYLLLSDGYLYDIVSNKDKLFKNGEQCKILDDSIKFEDVKINFYNYYLVGTDNKLYYINDKEIEEAKEATKPLLLNKDIKQVFEYYPKNYDSKGKDGYEKGRYYYESNKKYYVLKSDGNIYDTTYRQRYYYDNEVTKYTLIDEEIIISKENYGFIKSFEANYYNDTYRLEKIITDNSYYELKDVETEDCLKYEDVKCEQAFILNEKIDEYKNEIKYISNNKIVTKDNSILYTYSLMEEYY